MTIEEFPWDNTSSNNSTASKLSKEETDRTSNQEAKVSDFGRPSTKHDVWQKFITLTWFTKPVVASGLGLVHIMGIFRARHDPPNATTLFSKKEIASQPYLYRIMKLTMIPPQKNALNKAMLFTCWEKRGGWRGGGGNVPFPLNHCFFSNGLGWPHTTLRCEPFEKQHLQRHEGILCSSRLGCWKETFKGRL